MFVCLLFGSDSLLFVLRGWLFALYGGIGAFWRVWVVCIAVWADLVISFRLGSLG